MSACQNIKIQSSLVSQWVKDLALSLLWLRVLLCCGFNPYLLHAMNTAKKKQKQKKLRFTSCHLSQQNTYLQMTEGF